MPFRDLLGTPRHTHPHPLQLSPHCHQEMNLSALGDSRAGPGCRAPPLLGLGDPSAVVTSHGTECWGFTDGKPKVKVTESFPLPHVDHLGYPRRPGLCREGILVAGANPDPKPGQSHRQHPHTHPSRAGAASSYMLGLASEQTQLRAGCGARSWKTSSSAFPRLPEPGPGWTGLRSVLSKAWEPDEEWLGDRK